MFARFCIALMYFSVLLAPVLCAEVAFGETSSPSVAASATNAPQGERHVSNDSSEAIALQQQRIQSLQTALIEQDIKNQRELTKLQDAFSRQDEVLRKLAHNGEEDTHVSIMLTILGTMIGILGLGMAVFSWWGYNGVKEAATAKAKTTAEETVRQEIRRGSFDNAIGRAVDRIAYTPRDIEDEFDQEENENREGA